MNNRDDDFSLYPFFNGLPGESLEDYEFEVDSLVAGTKKEDRLYIGPRLLRRLGGIPGALARRELKADTLSKDGGHKLIIAFLEQKGYKKESLDRKLLAQKNYDAIRRRQGQTLQDYFAVENMAYADAINQGLKIDDDRRAYHMLLGSSLTEDQINHVYSFIYDPDATGLNPTKVQDAVLKFYDKPWDVSRHRDSRAAMGKYSRPFLGTAGVRSSPFGGKSWKGKGSGKGSYTTEVWPENFPTENDGYAYMDGYANEGDHGYGYGYDGDHGYSYDGDHGDDAWNYATEDGWTYTTEGEWWYDGWDVDAFLAGESEWLHRDCLDLESFDAYLDEECQADPQLAEALVGYKDCDFHY